jgi:hypothetical protein
MNLYAQASADTKAILEDSATGFGVLMTLTNPAGATQEITGQGYDISNTIDPETGQNISQRRVHVALPVESFTIGTPIGIASKTSKPWLVEFQLPTWDAPRKFRVDESLPDAVGVRLCFLDEWEE